jgi:hypothetical protein
MNNNLKKEEVFLKEIEEEPVNILKYLQKERVIRMKLIFYIRNLCAFLAVLLLVIAIIFFAFKVYEQSTTLILLFTSLALSIAGFLFRSIQNEEKQKYSKIERGLENIEKREIELKRVETIIDSEEKEKLLNLILEDIRIQKSVKP